MTQHVGPRGLERVPLGTTDVNITRLGLGTVPLGGKYQHISSGQAIQTVHCALDIGINWFDTAPRYGFGLAEQRLGLALASVPRDSYILATKVGWQVSATGTKAPNFSREGVQRSITRSLERLGIERIDIVHIHDPDDHYLPVINEVFPALAAMREQGLIRAVSIGMNQWEMLADFAHDTDVDCFLLAGRYTLLEHGALDTFLPLCQDRNIALLLGGVFNSGILASGATPDARYNYGRAPRHILHRVERFETVCARYGVPLYVAALQFPLAHPAVTALVVGAGSCAEVRANVAALDTVIPADLWSDLRAERLLPETAPTPSIVASSPPPGM